MAEYRYQLSRRECLLGLVTRVASGADLHFAVANAGEMLSRQIADLMSIVRLKHAAGPVVRLPRVYIEAFGAVLCERHG